MWCRAVRSRLGLDDWCLVVDPMKNHFLNNRQCEADQRFGLNLDLTGTQRNEENKSKDVKNIK